MKRVLSVLAVVFALVFSANFANAQVQGPSQEAQEKAASLSSKIQAMFSLEASQVEEVNEMNIAHYVFVERTETNPRFLNASEGAVNHVKGRHDKQYNRFFKHILSEDQYNIFLSEKQGLLDAVEQEFGG